MDHAQRVADLWSWLPAFRSVAESEHLPTASRERHVSASALSRSVRLLEEAVGRPLFLRQGRRLVLDEGGGRLLDAVRTAMRAIDDVVASVADGALLGPVRISAPGPYAALLVLPALRAVSAAHPGLVPEVVSLSADEVPAALLHGAIDVALDDVAVAHPGVRVARLAGIRHGVYCGPGHPLFRRGRGWLGHVLGHPFVAPPPGVDDRWPAERARTVGLRVSTMALAIEACAAGGLLAVLPDRAVAGDRRLRRLPLELGGSSALYLGTRAPAGPAATVIADALRETLAARARITPPAPGPRRSAAGRRAGPSAAGRRAGRRTRPR